MTLYIGHSSETEAI